MIKVTVIEKEVERLDEQIRLGDCKANDVVELDNGLVAVAVHENGYAVSSRYVSDNDLCLVFLRAGQFEVGSSFALDAINACASGRIKRIIGTLSGIEVTAK